MCKSYQDVKCLTALVQQIVNDYLATGAPLVLKGITDGSPAPAGIVGELFEGGVTVNVPLSASQNVQTVNLGTLQPGDWDCLATIYAGAAFCSFMAAVLQPVPAGVSTSMAGFAEDLDTTGTGSSFSVVCLPARALITVPTPMVFQISTIAPAAGQLTMYLHARRLR